MDFDLSANRISVDFGYVIMGIVQIQNPSRNLGNKLLPFQTLICLA